MVDALACSMELVLSKRGEVVSMKAADCRGAFEGMSDDQYSSSHSGHMYNSSRLEMAALDVDRLVDPGIDRSLEPVGLIGGFADSFGPADAYRLWLPVFEGTVADLMVHKAAE